MTSPKTARTPRARMIGVLLGLGAGLSAALNVQAADLTGAQIAAHGIGSVPACATCHGTQGQGNPLANFPRLAGMGAAYLSEQLTDYADGTRSNPIMSPFAKQLTPAQMKAVAAYYASLPAPKVSALPAASSDQDKLAQNLLTQGDWSRGIPACFACHGPMGVGVKPSFPALVGQSATYTEEQLKAWQQDHRAPGAGGLMAAVAKRLTPAEITAVAGYLAKISVQ
ncbi:c-type cytochrome [Halothiobacillus diazotrophicus]|nr:c-type cytochrome [Halothiobacillus diazotrophicus]